MRKFVALIVLVSAFFATSSVFAAPAEVSVEEFEKMEAASRGKVPPPSAKSPTSSTGSVDGVNKKSVWYIETANVVKDVVQVGLRLRGFNSLDTLSQPDGFATDSSDKKDPSLELSLQAKYRKFALEYDFHFGKARRLDTEFYGSSLGEITVDTNHQLIGKFFPFNLKDWGAVSIGGGAEYTKLGGAVSMGGFNFLTTGNGWSPVFQASYWYHVTRWMSLRFDYEMGGPRIETKIPGVPTLVSTYERRFAFGLSFGFGFGEKY